MRPRGISHAAFNVGGKGASPPVCHIGSAHCLRLFNSCVCSLPSRPGPDGSRRSARIGDAAFDGSGMGASPPVSHIGSVHFLRLFTACVCSLPSRPRPDGSRRSARIRHASRPSLHFGDPLSFMKSSAILKTTRSHSCAWCA